MLFEAHVILRRFYCSCSILWIRWYLPFLKHRIIQDICYSWLRFEREFGTLEDFDHAERKVWNFGMEFVLFAWSSLCLFIYFSMQRLCNPFSFFLIFLFQSKYLCLEFEVILFRYVLCWEWSCLFLFKISSNDMGLGSLNSSYYRSACSFGHVATLSPWMGPSDPQSSREV